MTSGEAETGSAEEQPVRINRWTAIAVRIGGMTAFPVLCGGGLKISLHHGRPAGLQLLSSYGIDEGGKIVTYPPNGYLLFFLLNFLHRTANACP